MTMQLDQLQNDLINKVMSSPVIKANTNPHAYAELKEILIDEINENDFHWDAFSKLICYVIFASIFHKDLDFAARLITKFDVTSRDTPVTRHILARFYHDIGNMFKSCEQFCLLHTENSDRLDILDMEKFLAAARGIGNFNLAENILIDALARYDNLLIWKLKALSYQIETAHLRKTSRETLVNNFRFLYPKVSSSDECLLLSSAAYLLGDFNLFVELTNRAIEKFRPKRQPPKEKLPFVADKCLESAIEITQCLESYGNKPFMVFGTLLGLYRDGKLMDYDKDADIGLYVNDLAEIHSMINRLCSENPHFVAPNVVMKSFESHKLNLAVYDLSRGTAVDLFFFRARERHVYTGIHTPCGPIEWVFEPFDLDTLTVDDVILPIPQNPERFLEAAYGDTWREPIAVWDSTVDCPNLSSASQNASTMFAASRLYGALLDGNNIKIGHYFTRLKGSVNYKFTPKAESVIEENLRRNCNDKK